MSSVTLDTVPTNGSADSETQPTLTLAQKIGAQAMTPGVVPDGIMQPAVLPLEEVVKYSGLELMQKMIAGELPPPPIAITLGFLLEEVKNGEAVFTGVPQKAHYNPIGSIHGGYHATLLDSCMACAVHTTLEPGQGYTTLEFKLNYVRPLTHKTGKVRAEGKVIHRGNRMATSEGRLVDEEGKLYAHGTETCMIFPLGG
ncbi:PaaI family thioesterase [Rhodovibrionaceae bacterium A322]